MNSIKYTKNLKPSNSSNYSFCEQQKENRNRNSNLHRRIDELQKILRKQYDLQLQSNALIKQQHQKIQNIEVTLKKIGNNLPVSVKQNLKEGIASSISSNGSHFQESISTFFRPNNESSTNKRRKTSKKSSKSNSIKFKASVSTNKIGSQKWTDNSPSDYSIEDNAKLLTSIVQRKLNIEKELKQRLKSHAVKNTKETHRNTIKYATFATER